MALQWHTVEELQAAKQAMIESLPGWSLPVAYAVGVRTGNGAAEFRVMNHQGTHDLPAIVLAKVLGYRTGSASYVLDYHTFDRAIEELAPAGECAAYEHPNLWAWQQLRADLVDGTVAPDASVVAVFIGEPDVVNDDLIRQLRRDLGIER